MPHAWTIFLESVLFGVKSSPFAYILTAIRPDSLSIPNYAVISECASEEASICVPREASLTVLQLSLALTFVAVLIRIHLDATDLLVAVELAFLNRAIVAVVPTLTRNRIPYEVAHVDVPFGRICIV